MSRGDIVFIIFIIFGILFFAGIVNYHPYFDDDDDDDDDDEEQQKEPGNKASISPIKNKNS